MLDNKDKFKRTSLLNKINNFVALENISPCYFPRNLYQEYRGNLFLAYNFVAIKEYIYSFTHAHMYSQSELYNVFVAFLASTLAQNAIDLAI